ncbi:MAG TPA: hypothetical protein VHR84_16000 [Terriglobales bacterium]|nr:hypothetical protein [Terriglobales bacterium]
MKHPRFVSTVVVVLSYMAVAQSSSQFRPEQPSSLLPSDRPRTLLIAQNGGWDQIMAQKCREWDLNPKSAPASAAWTCVNGRAATQHETNEAIDRFHRQGQQNAQRMVDQQRKQQKDVQQIIHKYSGTKEASQGNTFGQPVQSAGVQAVPALSLPAAWSFAHPNADLAIAIHVAALGQSPTLQQLFARLPESVQVNAQSLTRQLRQIGDVDEAWLSIHGGDFVGLVQGRTNFPPGFVQLANGMSSYRISKTAVVFGKPASVSAAVERLAHSAVPAALSRRMKAECIGTEICMSGTAALLSTQSTMQFANAKNLSGFSFGLSLREGLKVQVRLNSTTVVGARRLLSEINKSTQQPDAPVNVTAQLDGTSVRMNVTIPQAQLLEAFDKGMASPAGQRLTAMASTPPSNKITIQGLSGGSKELQINGQPAPPATDTKAAFGNIVVQGMPGGTKVIPSPPQR